MTIWSVHVHFEADDQEQAERLRHQLLDLIWDNFEPSAAVSPLAAVAPLVVFDWDAE